MTMHTGLEIITSEIQGRIERAHGQATRALRHTDGLSDLYIGRTAAIADLERAIHCLRSAAANLGMVIDLKA